MLQIKKSLKPFRLTDKGSSIGIERIAFIGALLVISILGIIMINNLRILFDEGFNLQVPIELLNNGKYQTFYDGAKLFNPLISTGPTVLIPISLVFKGLGVGIVQARIVNLLYFIGTIVLIILFSKNGFSKYQGWFTLFLFLSVPEIFTFGVTVLGEIPSIFFLLLAAWFFEKKRNIICGLFLGMAVLTKFILILSIAPVVIMLGLDIWKQRQSWLKSVKFYALVLLSSAIPIAAWEATKLITLRKSVYLQDLRTFYYFFKSSSGTSGINPIEQFLAHKESLTIPYNHFLPVDIVVILLFVVVLFAGYVTLNQSVCSARTFLYLYAVIHVGWWLFFSNQGIWRHLMPGYLVFLFFIGEFLIFCSNYLIKYLKVFFSRYFIWQRVWLNSFLLSTGLFSLILLYTFPTLANQYRLLTQDLATNGLILKDQHTFATKLKDIINSGGSVGTWGWFQNPEISFLCQCNFTNIENPDRLNDLIRLSAENKPTYLIKSNIQDDFLPGIWDGEKVYAGEMLFNKAGYQLYRFQGQSTEEK